MEGLRSCMSSSPRFAEFCLPLILEKLSSDVTRAKIDSLLTLVKSLTYSCLEISLMWVMIWSYNSYEDNFGIKQKLEIYLKYQHFSYV